MVGAILSMSRLAHLRVATLTFVFVAALPGCFLLSLGGDGGDDGPSTFAPSPDVRLLVSDGEQLLLLGRGGLEVASEGFPIALRTQYLAASADRSRIVVTGVDPVTEEHGLWLLQNGAFERLADDIVGSRVGEDAQWIWAEGAGLANTVALYHHEGGGAPAVSGVAPDLALMAFGPGDAFVILKEGTAARVVHPDDDPEEASFDPGMGSDWFVAAVRPNSLLIRASTDEPGTWFSLTGEEAVPEDSVPRLGYTLSEGTLTWRATAGLVDVAIGLPDDIDQVIASDLAVVLVRRGAAIAFFDRVGGELDSFAADLIPDAVGGELPDAAWITTVLPMGSRQGVLVVEHTVEASETGTVGRSYATVHEYDLDETNTLVVRRISDRTASMSPGHFGHSLGSAYVAWVEDSNVVAYHDITTGDTQRLEVERDLYFEAHHASDGIHY